jgi:plastocyanin
MDTMVRAERTATTWTTVARRSGIAEAGALALAAAGLRDLEAAAIAVGIIVCLALTRSRLASLALAALALLSANIAFWMGSGAVSNITHGEGFWETALPAALTVTAILTVVAAVGAITRRSPAGAAVAQASAVLVLALALITSAIGLGDGVDRQSGDLSIVTEHVRFSDRSLGAEAGEIGVHVSNKDLFWHTFTIAALDVDVSVPVGAERRVSFTAEPGRYTFVCTIPGHTQAGMEGALTVR